MRFFCIQFPLILWFFLCQAFYSLCEDVIHKEKEKDKSSVENNNHLGQTEEVGQKDTTQLITDNKEKKFTCCNVSWCSQLLIYDR